MNLPISTFSDMMSGEDCLVVADGPTARRIPPHVFESHWTISCNRAVTFARPDFAVCLEPPADRRTWPVVKAANPLFVITHAGRQFPRCILVQPNVREWLDPRGVGGRLFVGMSPLWAIASAIVMGFETIGVVGLDFERDRYPDGKERDEKEAAFAELVSDAEKVGSKLLNLNTRSKLESIPPGFPWNIRTKQDWSPYFNTARRPALA